MRAEILLFPILLEAHKSVPLKLLKEVKELRRKL